VNDDPTYYLNTSGISHGTGVYVGRHQVGYAPYSYWVYKQLYDSNGNPVQNGIADLNEDGVINIDDQYCAGDANPDFYYGLNVKLSYKNWDFGFNGHGSFGYMVFNDFASNNSSSYFDVNAGNLPNYAYAVKRTGFTAQNSDRQYLTDLFIEDASFFRMDDINFGYTFKEIDNWNGNIRVAVSCQNVFVITKYSGVDPEVNNTNGVDGAFCNKTVGRVYLIFNTAHAIIYNSRKHYFIPCVRFVCTVYYFVTCIFNVSPVIESEDSILCHLTIGSIGSLCTDKSETFG
jgi:iron complex outermembrane receptor protein